MKTDPKEIRGDRAGLNSLIEEGQDPEHVVIHVFDAVATLLTDLMDTVPQTSVRQEVRWQVASLATVVDNAKAALRVEVLEVPDDVKEALIGVIGEALNRIRKEDDDGDGAEG